MAEEKRAIIVGAGPAGLTAAYELLKRTGIKPVVFETTGDIGGISKTVDYKGNKIDIGGHRFFSKSSRVMKWWLSIFPLQGFPAKDDIKLERKVRLSKEQDAPDPEKDDNVMLSRKRVSRIFLKGKFFSYPLSLDWKTVRQIGILEGLVMLFSYFKRRISGAGEEKNLEDFFINRFGKDLGDSL